MKTIEDFKNEFPPLYKRLVTREKIEHFKNEYPLLYKRLVEAETPKLEFVAGGLKETLNKIMEPLGYPTVRGRDSLDQTFIDIERFLESQS